MIVKGKYAEAKVYTEKLDQGTYNQIERLLDQDFMEDSCVRIMPDVHKGMGCVIGFTADMGSKLIPNIVGVDIGCGMLTVKLTRENIDLEELDKLIRREIPSGFRVRNKVLEDFPELKDLNVYGELKNVRRLERSLGSLGGGNHFIEVAVDSRDDKYLIIHTGSRNLGHQVAEYYQNLAVDISKGGEDFNKRKEELKKEYTNKKDLRKALRELEKEYKKLSPKYPKDLCYLEGEARERYLEDMKICQEFASRNRKGIAGIILRGIFNRDLDDFDYFETIHNYIDFEDNIVRKGAISARKDELILIPINMRDGSILARGRGNPQWNNSAPHGAGRILSRRQAREEHSLKDFKKDMEGIYTSSVSKDTLDENPRAYKPMEEILNSLDQTAEVIDILKPIYNFKSS